ncbi:MAG: hypothetical protein JJT82_00120 [Legionellaceae bacterium]|nr:hypothetical protein [Legionellaceae bacterium]
MVGLLNLLVLIIIAGVITWLVHVTVPMPAVFHTLFRLVVIALLVVYILQFFEIINPVLPWFRLFK